MPFAVIWHIELHPESWKYLAFICDGRNYVFKLLPFGLVKSVAIFIKCMDQVLGPECYILPLSM